LQQVLSQTACPSQLLLTSQDIPGELDTVASRYPQFWHCQPLQGLDGEEQQDLFQKLGLLSNPGATDPDYLSPIGAFYAGHPLVLQVIADEIRQPPFRGNIAHYWQHYEAEFTATTTTTNKLARSRLFRRRVRQRVEQTLQQLPAPARQMLCASAVFRRPVTVEFWQAMLPEGDADAAFDTLQDRHLVEYAAIPSVGEQSLLAGERSRTTPPLLIRQHNLIRSVAYDLLKADTAVWQAAERQAAHLWLNDYEPAPDAPNLETVRGYLEAFDHYCEVGDWEQASEIYTYQLPSTNQALHWQLLIWSQYKELIEVSRKLTNHISSQTKRLCLNQIGNSYRNLGNIKKAIEYYQQALQFTRETGDRNGEGAALGNMGNAYDSLGQYERAIDFHQQHLTIAQEIGDSPEERLRQRNGEGNALGNLGIAYSSLGQYERAIDFHQQYLTIAREIGDSPEERLRQRNGEGAALGNLGVAYDSLGQYERAIDCHQQYLTIAREIGDRQGEGNALCNTGETQLKLHQYPESLTNSQAALAIFQEIGDKAGKAEALKNLAELHQALGETETARQYGQQALALATELGIPLKAECEALMQELGTGGEGKQE
jgi:tetratricopeptide (TPR) repeat protein